ncbi:ERV-BabFcenv provirus ancestral Env polyprotein [Sciurus carolinensis]|uniref:ERV-BabFcenv provirus ancestral Env polyprotein n=1 Tax=Sciurus carolinensis TaxID=30640 RepID=A0AA41MBU3_SCICA|nr:ERV-BabFcenv provirus ancestral Env polyprotein [Sciurus carolinensis]
MEKDCSPTGCDQEITLHLKVSKTISISSFYAYMVCFLYDHYKPHCKRDPAIYGGCPYNSCERYYPGPSHGNTIRINIKDPWAPKWASGVNGKVTWANSQLSHGFTENLESLHSGGSSGSPNHPGVGKGDPTPPQCSYSASC